MMKQQKTGTGTGAVVRKAAEEPRRRGRKPLPRLSPCGRFKREFCDRGLSGLMEGARSDRTAMRRVGRRNCAILQCLEERGFPSCEQCTHAPCVFQDKLDQICPAGSATEKGRSWRLVALSPGTDLTATAEAAPAVRPRMKVPDRSVARLRWYLAAMEAFRQAGIKVVSSADIGTKVGVSPSLVRRDLCYFGQFGTPSRGYEVAELLKGILTVFEVVRERWVAWIGAERLRSDPRVLEQCARHNWQVAAVFDPDPAQLNTEVSGMRVLEMASLGRITSSLEIDAAVLAVREE